MSASSGSGLNLLIAGACVAVITGVGYYMTKEYRWYEQDRRDAEQAELDAVLRASCLDVLGSLNVAFSISPTEKNQVDNCLEMGAISTFEVKRREAVLGVRIRN